MPNPGPWCSPHGTHIKDCWDKHASERRQVLIDEHEHKWSILRRFRGRIDKCKCGETRVIEET